MILFFLGFQIIHMYINFFLHYIMENCHYCLLISPKFSTPRRHDFIAIYIIWHDKNGLVLVFLNYYELIIPWKPFHKVHKGINGNFYNIIN
jgi:hypothetical protein